MLHEPATFVFSDLKEGMTASFDVDLNDELIASFAKLSGDESPLHVDDAFAKTTPFGGRIAHGMISAMLYSQLVGMHLPGKNAVYLSQTMRFHKPVKPGTKVTIRGTVKQTVEAAQAIRMLLETVDIVTGDVVADGEAMVRLTN